MSTPNSLPMIAHLVFKLDYGGLENGLVNIINNYPENEFQHAIICLTDFTDFSKRINKSEIKIYAVNKRPGKDIKAYIKLYKLLKKIKPTILHTRNLATIDGQLCAFLARVPIRLHGEHGRDVEDPDGNNKKNILIRKIFSLFIHHFIALSNDLNEYLVNAVKINKSKVSQIYNGVDTNKFISIDSGKEILHEQVGYEKFIVIGTVGRLEVIKDQLTLVFAVEELLKNHPHLSEQIRIVIVGSGSMRDKIAQEIQDRKLTNVINLLGSKDCVDKIMKSFDVFVLPSLAEGVSNTILEAMSTGLPVVATNVGGNSELVVEGSTGFLVPSADPSSMASALYKYIEDKSMRDLHGSNARKLVEQKFSLMAMVENYRSLYTALRTNKVLN